MKIFPFYQDFQTTKKNSITKIIAPLQRKFEGIVKHENQKLKKRRERIIKKHKPRKRIKKQGPVTPHGT